MAETIPKLIEAGHVERVLISQDVCRKGRLKRYGGTGYAFILEKLIPQLRAQGVTEEHIRTIIV